ncbi:MFS transporter, UMF1 family [Quadrisphaera granulorum]|uniref:UMF1 family MFS transporter n=1 Tax=Quadrisphaera granulorum TaxID=317664 RepID=A0A316A7L2_9ACTN|nr:MFS transporter [Quadrisphaera granulorum]PWJ53198.1 UMF1 family MFS transporter [Quadrisphaera granulorum]SZE97130.1 MFS transporter, UMF1 family [Quadrisphaera granulorum]
MNAPQSPTPREPVLTEAQRGRARRAWYVYDWANSAYVTTTATVLFSPYLTAIAEAAACPGGVGEVVRDGATTCPVALSVLGIPVAPGSLALYVVTFATLLSAIVLPAVGAVADRSRSPRRLLSGFAWVGATAAAAMVFVSGDRWVLGALLQLVASLCLGASLVVYDSLLVRLARPEERDRISSRGWAMGYAGGALLLAANLVLLSSADALGLDQGSAVRLSLLTAGLWWGAFTLVPHLGLRRLDGEPAVVVAPGSALPRGGTARVVLGSLGQLVRTLRGAPAYPQTLLFLIAYLFFNDGVQTVIAAASIYGQQQLGLASNQLVIAILLVQVVALLGALLAGGIAQRTSAKATILGSLVIWIGVVVAGMLIPAGRFGLFLVLAASIGLVLGGTQALSRSLFSQLVPVGREAEWFGLYQSAERGTSWLGTLVFGLVFQLTGSYRPAIASLVVFFVVGGVLLARLDVARGRAQAQRTTP